MGLQPAFAQIAEIMADAGWVLRTGAAKGADQFFAAPRPESTQLLLPWPCYEKDFWLGKSFDLVLPQPMSPMAYDYAQPFHPVWDRLSSNAQRLHARNAHIIQGPYLNDPVRCVICWASPKGPNDVSGGTGLAYRLARARSIPVLNLYGLDGSEVLDTFGRFTETIG